MARGCDNAQPTKQGGSAANTGSPTFKICDGLDKIQCDDECQTCSEHIVRAETWRGIC